MILNIALCADNPKRTLQVQNNIAQFRLCPIKTVLFHTPYHLIHGMTEKQFHIIILFPNSEMKETDFIETMQQLAPQAQLILLTGQSKTAFSCDDIPNPFLLPASADGIFLPRILAHTILSMRARKYLFYFPCNGQPYSIYCSDILYFEKRNRKIIIHSTQGIYQFYDRLHYVTEQLSPAMFLHSHKNLLINILYVQKLSHRTVLMQNAAVLPVSPKYRQKLYRYFEDFQWL